MKTYIFLTNQYLPKPGATGMCVHNIAKRLAEEIDNKVYTICYGSGDKYNSVIDAVNVIKIKNPKYYNIGAIKNKIKQKIYHYISIIAKIIHIYNYPLRNNSLVNKYIREVEKIIKTNSNITIIASYTPLEAVVAGMKLKNKYGDKIKIIYYSTDTLSNEQGNDSILPAKYREKSGLKWENRLFKIYDLILIMECHQKYYYQKHPSYLRKFKIVNFPLIENNVINKKNKESKISLIYAGTLYKQLRNPSFMLNMLNKISRNINIKVDIMGSGDCNDIIDDAMKKSKNIIKYHGMVNHEEVIKYIKSCDILLSIGNKESPMMPSKIYEYISTGKPIIHIYSSENDPCLEPLRKYGNSLLIRDGDFDCIKMVEKFINNKHVLDYSIIKDMFETSTPEYTIKIIKRKGE